MLSIICSYSVAAGRVFSLLFVGQPRLIAGRVSSRYIIIIIIIIVVIVIIVIIIIVML